MWPIKKESNPIIKKLEFLDFIRKTSPRNPKNKDKIIIVFMSLPLNNSKLI